MDTTFLDRPVVTVCSRRGLAACGTLFLVAVISHLWTPLLAQYPGLNDAWRWSRYGPESGVPSERVISIIELPGRRAWIHTTTGIAWFDGHRWNTVHSPVLGKGTLGTAFMSPAPRSGMFVSWSGRLLHVDTCGLQDITPHFRGRPLEVSRAVSGADGKVFVQSGRTLFQLFDSVLVPAGLPFDTAETDSKPRIPFGIMWTKGGVPWLLASIGAYRWESGRWSRKAVGTPGMPLRVGSLIESAEGEAFFTSQRIAFEAYEIRPGKRPIRYTIPPGSATATIDRDAQGQMIALLQSGETVVIRGMDWQVVSPLPPRMMNSTVYHFRPNGDLWVGTENGVGLCRLTADSWSFLDIPARGLHRSISELCRASDGTLWVGTSWGVYRRTPGGSKIMTDRIGDSLLGTITGIAEDRNGHMWISSGNAFSGAYRWDGRTWKWYGLKDGLVGERIHKIARDARGNLWFLSIGSAMPDPAFERERGVSVFDGVRFRHFGAKESLGNARVYAFAEDSSGAYWFGTYVGLSRLRHGAWTHWKVANGLKQQRVFALAVDRTNRLWFGHIDGGLGYIDSLDKPQYLPTGPGLLNDHIWALAVDERNMLFAATRGGIGCKNGEQWTTITLQAGLPTTFVWPLLPVRDTLYIGTQGHGVALFHYGTVPRVPPVVTFEEPLIRADATVIRWNANAFLGDVAPERVLTRYRTNGGEWSPWGTERETTVGGARGWGEHTVEVQALGLLADFTQVPARITVETPPPMVLRPEIGLPLLVLLATIGTLVSLAVVRNKRFNTELRTREERFRIVAIQTGQLVYDYDVRSGLIAWSGAIEQLTGYSPEEFARVNITGWEEMIHPDDRKRAVEELEAAEATSSRYQVEYRFRRKDGTYIHVFDSGIFLHEHPGPRPRMLGAMSDITERRSAEQQVKESLREKEVLLKEIHHRVKNNLQVISSLLNMQSLSATDVRAIDQLRDSQNRIKTMALIHERLYQSENLANINFGDYLKSLVAHLSRSYTTPGIRMDVSADDVRLPVNLAIPCGLIVNELVSNALKHAFPDGRTGCVEVRLNAGSDSTCRITVRDDGIGIPAGLDVGSASTLGLQLIDALSRQIGASLDVERSQGTSFALTISTIAAL